MRDYDKLKKIVQEGLKGCYDVKFIDDGTIMAKVDHIHENHHVFPLLDSLVNIKRSGFNMSTLYECYSGVGQSKLYFEFEPIYEHEDWREGLEVL